MRLLRTYPKEQGMTRRFFSETLEFHCRSCRNVVESRYRIESPEGVICGQCYSDKLAGIPIVQYRDTEQTPRVKKKAALELVDEVLFGVPDSQEMTE